MLSESGAFPNMLVTVLPVRPAVSSSRGTSQWKLGSNDTVENFTFVSEYWSLLCSVTRAVWFHHMLWSSRILPNEILAILWPYPLSPVTWDGGALGWNRHEANKGEETLDLFYDFWSWTLWNHRNDAGCPHIFEKLEVLETSKQKSPCYLFSLKANLG